jgi:hypothetical protein
MADHSPEGAVVIENRYEVVEIDGRWFVLDRAWPDHPNPREYKSREEALLAISMPPGFGPFIVSLLLFAAVLTLFVSVITGSWS